MATLDAGDAKTYGDALTYLNSSMNILSQAADFPDLNESQTNDIEGAMASVAGLQSVFLGQPVTAALTPNDKEYFLHTADVATRVYAKAGGKVPGINSSLDPYVNAVTDAIDRLPIPKLGLPSVSWVIVVVFFIFVIGAAALYYFTNRRVIA